MTIERMIELLKIELQCVTRKSRTNCHSCDVCDLVQSDAELQEMYTSVIGILQSQGKISFDGSYLNRDDYVKIGDIMDCLGELAVSEDVAFQAVGLIEWAMGKRAIPKESLLKTTGLCEDAVSRKAAVSRISDLLMLELRGERLPTWNEVYRALEELPTVTPKAQEPRLLTPEDFEDNPDVDDFGYLPCWWEFFKARQYDGWGRTTALTLKSSDGMPLGRAWTSRPTDEQRSNTPWQTKSTQC